MKNAFLYVAIALCAAVGAPTVESQDLGGALDLPMLGQGLVLSSTMHAHAERDAARLRGKSGGSRVVRSGSRPAPGGSPKVSTRFRPSLAARRGVLAKLVAQTRAVDPPAAARLQNFLGGDPIAPLKPTLARYGLRADDAADATAMYLVVAWYGSRGLDKDPPISLVRAVRAQMKRALPTLPAFAAASNAAKQQMGDSMWIQTIVVASSLGAAKGNPTLMAQTKQAVRRGAMKAFKLDMTKLKLSANGLRA